MMMMSLIKMILLKQCVCHLIIIQYLREQKNKFNVLIYRIEFHRT